MRRVRTGDDWRELIDRSLRDSLRAGDADGFAATVQFMISLFDAESRLDEALAEIENASKLASNSPGAAGFLLAQRAALLSGQGHREAALEAVEQSEALLEAVRDSPIRNWPVLLETVRLKLLLPPSPRMAALEALGGMAEAQVDYSFLMSWYIPYLAARGDRRNAQPLIQLARAAAAAIQHKWRLSDVDSFDTWLLMVRGILSRDEPGRPVSTLAAWREATLWLRSAALRRDMEAIPRALDAIDSALRVRKSSDHGGFLPWHAIGRLLLGDASLVPQLHPPHAVTLSNLGTWLAGAHAVAVGGPRELAAPWLAWARKLGEQGIESSMEWPVSRRRVEAMLLLRTGQQARANVGLQRAADWAAENGYRGEEAIATLQAEHMVAMFGGPQVRQLTRTDSSALDFLITRGMDPWLHTAAVESAALAGSAAKQDLLTAREIEILRLLADDLTYREVAATLSISFHTVRGTAHAIYQKLGVTTKHAAAQEGRALGLI